MRRNDEEKSGAQQGQSENLKEKELAGLLIPSRPAKSLQNNRGQQKNWRNRMKKGNFSATE